jgi:hypothetical protein
MTSNQDQPDRVFDIVNHTPDQEGQDIRDEDVVRPINHRCSINHSNERKRWRLKNRTQTMTHGSCTLHFKAGLCSMACLKHDGNPHNHGFWMCVVQAEGLLPGRLINSLTLAEMFGLGIQVAKADRLVCPNMQQMNQFNFDVHKQIIYHQTILQHMNPEDSVTHTKRMKKRHSKVFEDEELRKAPHQRSRERQQAGGSD